ncbi:DUF983 domain-containing protein [Flavobacteriaceae bacterium AU392]|nr:DUF983 domain-containing protein [Flavobacteriaceae bacterium]RKM81480.1 DUF983 domain-containing protein [Flavobacteriaceae bacterium AU392]
MLKKGNKLYGILSGRCPKCHAESMYINKNAYRISETLKMHERCSNCNTKYKIEPSFFYGSMYVSYGVGIAFAVASFMITNLMLETSLIVSFIGIVLTMLIFLPIILRLSRNIWINMFMSYDKSLAKKAS